MEAMLFSGVHRKYFSVSAALCRKVMGIQVVMTRFWDNPSKQYRSTSHVVRLVNRVFVCVSSEIFKQWLQGNLLLLERFYSSKIQMEATNFCNQGVT